MTAEHGIAATARRESASVRSATYCKPRSNTMVYPARQHAIKTFNELFKLLPAELQAKRSHYIYVSGAVTGGNSAA